MTYEEAEAYLESLKPGGMKWGLARMRRALGLLGNPQNRLRTVHVAGTNGKGSVCRMIEAAAAACGYRVGVYASPAVTGLRDTITMGGTSISPEEFAGLTGRIRELEPELETVGGLSEFELTTVLALCWFAEQQPDLCVVECGLGGRLDATNVFEAPLAAVFTPISLDHTAVLGNTVEDIARQKAGILRPGCGVVCAPGQDPEALAVLMEEAAALGLTLHMPGGACPVTQEEPGRLTFPYRGVPVTLGLTGRFQRYNALTALETLHCLESRGYRFPVEDAVQGLEKVSMPCRQEILRFSPLVMVDGAHNPQGVGALAETLRRLFPAEEGALTMVTGMLRDKDTAACARLLGPLCARVFCCTPPVDRGLPAEEMAEEMRRYCRAVTVCPAPEEALRGAQAAAGDGPLLIAGSFYVASVLRPLLLEERQNPAGFGK